MADDYYHYDFKMILIGSSGVGKSCILGRIKDPDKFLTDPMPTMGMDFSVTKVQVEDKTIKIQLWDTAGQEKYRTITKAYYRSAVGGFLVFDVKDRKSFDELSNWVEDAKEGAYPREPTFVLVGNKIEEDVNEPRVVSQTEAKEFAQHFGMDYIETSARTGQNVDELLPFLASRVYWKLRIGDIVLEEGWQGVTKGNSKPIQIMPQPPLPRDNRRCCN